MRQIGKRRPSLPGLNPDPESLRMAAIHQKSGQVLAAVPTTGIAKGIYRFASHEEMNRFDDEALARAIAANVRRRESRGNKRQ
jgi:hypothetical protein